MKKLTYLLFAMFAVIVQIGCEKEPYINVPDEPNVRLHTYFESMPGHDALQFDYALGNTLKSTFAISDTAVQYIRFVSYYSADEGQRNIHEIRAYTDTVNVLLNDTTLKFESNRLPQFEYNQMVNVVDGVLVEREDTGTYDFTDRGRWASLRWLNLGYEQDSVYYSNLKHFSDSLKTLMSDNAGNDSILNEIINNTAYFDTVYLTINMNRQVNIDRLELYLGCNTQIFDVFVSIDGDNWTLLKPDDYITVYDEE